MRLQKRVLSSSNWGELSGTLRQLLKSPQGNRILGLRSSCGPCSHYLSNLWWQCGREIASWWIWKLTGFINPTERGGTWISTGTPGVTRTCIMTNHNVWLLIKNTNSFFKQPGTCTIKEISLEDWIYVQNVGGSSSFRAFHASECNLLDENIGIFKHKVDFFESFISIWNQVW